MVLLKVVMPVTLDDTVNVSVTANDCAAAICAPCPVQVMVMKLLAVVGLQLPTAKLSVIVVPPVFLT